jgi:hypothetical protein
MILWRKSSKLKIESTAFQSKALEATQDIYTGEIFDSSSIFLYRIDEMHAQTAILARMV